MNFFEIHPSTVYLKGITRTAVFGIRNRNDFLAASYTVQFISPNYNNLTVFPEKGILLHGEQQKIRIKCCSQDTECSMSELSSSVLVRYTYKTDYNKHYLTKSNMKGWDQISPQIYEKTVEIIAGGERDLIENCIKEDIKFEKTFGKDSLNISVIQQKEKSFVNDESFADLEIDSRTLNLPKFELNNSRQISQIGKQNKSAQKIFSQTSPSDNLFPLQYGESRIRTSAVEQANYSSKSNKSNQNLVQSRMVIEDLSKSFELSMKTAQCKDFSNESSGLYRSRSVQDGNRTMELILLAVLAAFFVALGNNVGRIFK